MTDDERIARKWLKPEVVADHPTLPFKETNMETGSTGDSIVDAVIEEHRVRAAKGLEKYGTNCDRDDLPLPAWLTHAREEAMDQAIYLKKAENVARRLVAFAKDVRDNFDCDADAHRYGTMCRCCEAGAVLSEVGDVPPARNEYAAIIDRRGRRRTTHARSGRGQAAYA